MRLRTTKSAHSTSYSVIKSAYINKKRTTVTVEKLGNENEIRKRTGCSDPLEWARQYVAELNRKAKEDSTTIQLDLSPVEPIPSGQNRKFNVGYLFLQSIYYDLGLDRICKAIRTKYGFKYDLNAILSRLVYARIIDPCSKLSTYERSKSFVEPPKFELHDIYRALSVIAQESDYIQSRLYRNSLDVDTRKTGIIYYDCTNFFFEIESEEGLKQYGHSKENRPLPITQMGLFMDTDGIPLAFCIDPGNTNEQKTLIPLEKKLEEKFDLSKFVVCTDAGLSSLENRKFNSKQDRAFITTQSIKKMKAHLKEWALAPEGWYLPGDQNTVYDISCIDDDIHKDKLFYKERWIKENGFEQRLIVSYSIKYRNYQRSIRHEQIERAQAEIASGARSMKTKRQTDYKRFIQTQVCTDDGEIIEKKHYCLDEGVIQKEEAFDGFYASCTNLEDDAADILKINRQRWEIEECFKISKSEFKARPVYLKRDDHIKAHFMTCFIALIVYRYLEKKLDDRFTCRQILRALRDMDMVKYEGKGYVPAYSRSDLTDALHQKFGFDTAVQIVPIEKMRKICGQTKK